MGRCERDKTQFADLEPGMGPPESRGPVLADAARSGESPDPGSKRLPVADKTSLDGSRRQAEFRGFLQVRGGGLRVSGRELY